MSSWKAKSRPDASPGRAARLVALVCALLLAVPAAHAQSGCLSPSDGCAEGGERFGSAVARGDFNGDGFLDLAVGVFLEAIGSIGNAGAVQVIYGTASGLGRSNSQFWSQNSANVEDVAEADDLFGVSLAAGDFNGDGFDDLAIGVVGETTGSRGNAGAVNVIHGSSTGLSATAVPDQLWSQDSANVGGVSEGGDFFGSSLAAVDFNGDGFDDLAVGVPGEDLGSDGDVGAVNVIHGSPGGLSATLVPDQLWSQDGANVEDVTEAFDDFGASLAAADFNADGFADLAVGVPGEHIGSIPDAGAANVIYGSATGLSSTAVPDVLWNQNSLGVEDVAEAFDSFGSSLATADFNGDGFDDLAVGVPFEGIGNLDAAGVAHVIFGSLAGLTTVSPFVPDQLLSQDGANVEGVAEGFDRFGSSLAAGDFDGDGFDDLAIGVPFENLGSFPDAGAVNVLYGSPTRLSATIVPDQLWSQDSANVEDVAEPVSGLLADNFGSSLAAGDFNGDGRDDLAIGVPHEDLASASGQINEAGAVNVIHGASGGLNATAVPDQLWTQVYTAPAQP